jgi:hypothetical protein
MGVVGSLESCFIIAGTEGEVSVGANYWDGRGCPIALWTVE